jgi:hypothetical protein
MTSALAPLSNVAALAHTATAYVRRTPAPEPASIMLHPRQRSFDIQPGTEVGDSAVAVLGSLMVWTHPLVAVTGDWWHTSRGSLHIALTGRLGNGIGVRVYDGIPIASTHGLITLPKGERESVIPDEIYRLALALRDKENPR